MIDFYDPTIKNDVTNVYVVDDLVNAKETRTKIIKILHTYEFNEKILELYNHQQLTNENTVNLLKKFGFDNNFQLNYLSAMQIHLVYLYKGSLNHIYKDTFLPFQYYI